MFCWPQPDMWPGPVARGGGETDEMGVPTENSCENSTHTPLPLSQIKGGLPRLLLEPPSPGCLGMHGNNLFFTNLSPAPDGNRQAGSRSEAGGGSGETTSNVAQLEPEAAPGHRGGPSEARGTHWEEGMGCLGLDFSLHTSVGLTCLERFSQPHLPLTAFRTLQHCLQEACLVFHSWVWVLLMNLRHLIMCLNLLN